MTDAERIRYKHEHGSYYLMNGESIVLTCDQVAIAIDPESGTMLKHGDPVSVATWMAKHQCACESIGMAPAVTLVLPRHFPVDEINRCISTAGYAGTILNRVQAQS